MTTELAPGVVIEGRYRVDRLIGKGGMGEVWAVTHLVMQCQFALKVLKGTLRSRRAQELFINEAKLASWIKHPNVVKVFDFFERDGTSRMLMELLEGETLRDRLRREPNRALPFDVAAPMLLQLVSAIGTAHAAGVVHRDIKPENVFLCSAFGNAIDLRVLDFGIAKFMRSAVTNVEESGNATRPEHIMGTTQYMSFEQAKGAAVDHRTDIWSLGVLMYEVLSGARPVEGRNLNDLLSRLEHDEVIHPIGELVPELPPDVCALIDRMLQTRAESRLADLREAYDVLDRYVHLGEIRKFNAPQPEVPPPPASSPNAAPYPTTAADDFEEDTAIAVVEFTGRDPVWSAELQMAPSSGRELRNHGARGPRLRRAVVASASALATAALAWVCGMRAELSPIVDPPLAARVPWSLAIGWTVELPAPMPERGGQRLAMAPKRISRRSGSDHASAPRAWETPPSLLPTDAAPRAYISNDPTWSRPPVSFPDLTPSAESK